MYIILFYNIINGPTIDLSSWHPDLARGPQTP